MFDLFRNYTRIEKRDLMEKRERIRNELREELKQTHRKEGL